VFNAGLYEAQDVLAQVDAVDLLHMQPRRGLRLKEQWQRWLLYKDPTDMLMFANPGLHPVKLDREYEAFVILCQTYWDLLYANAIRGWKDQCRTSVCWIDEIWAAAVPRYKNWLKALENFDHICVGQKKSASILSDLIGRKCHFVPGAVDTLRFCPYPSPPERVVDFYSVGRRWESIHNALLQLSAQTQRFYVYDTLQDVTSMRPISDAQHRQLYANVAKRSRYFVVAPAKMNVPGDTEGESEVGFRYFEGAASGAVMIGQAPDCEHFHDLFDWPDPLVEIKPDGSDVSEVVSSLDATPDRRREMGRRNAAEALLRHDWVHRWKMIWDIAGITVSSGMLAREHTLAARASQVLADNREPLATMT
jgi:spore maturation protein CgeB